MNVHEGDVYKLSQVSLSGDMVVPESELRRLLQGPGNEATLRENAKKYERPRND